MIFSLVFSGGLNKLRCVWVHPLQVRVQKAEAEVYAAVIGDLTGVGQLDKDKCFLPRIAVKVGPGDWSPQKHHNFQYGGHHLAPKVWELSCSGHNFAVWKAIFVDEK
jgi:Alpha-amylase C-terminal beta-sheet domain